MTSPDFLTYLFTQGVLGVVCAGLVVTILYLLRKLDQKEATIQTLNDNRLADAKEVQKDLGTVLSGNSQANQLLAAKIEAVKGKV